MYARRCPAAPARRSREPPLRSPRSHAGALDRTFWPRWSSPSMGCTCPCIAKASATREGVPIEVSTLADWVGAVSVALQPLVEAIKAHVLAGSRIHADDTPVPVLAKGKTRTGRLWTVVRDDRPFGGTGPPAAAYFYSPDRRGEHAQAFLTGYAGVLQADAYSGFGQLYAPGRLAGAITEAACWAHARRKFFEIAELKKAPIAIEAVRRIDALFAIERELNGMTAEGRRTVRAERSRR